MNELATTDKAAEKRAQWEALIVPEARKLLASDEAAQAFMRVILTAFNKSPKLMACSQSSLMASILDAATLNLLPNTPAGHCYIIPRKQNDVLTACLELGYRGYCELAYRGQMVADIDGNVIREGDDIEYREGTDGFVNFTRALGAGRSKKPIRGCYVVVTMKDGAKHVKVLDADQLEAFKTAMLRQNFGKPTPAWQFFEDEMYLKSALKRVAKLLPLGNYVQKAIEIEHRAPVVPVSAPALKFADEPAPAITDAEPDSQVDPATGEFVWK